MTPPFLGCQKKDIPVVEKKSGPSFDHLCLGDVGNLGLKNVGGDCTPYLVDSNQGYNLYFRGLYVSQLGL